MQTGVASSMVSQAIGLAQGFLFVPLFFGAWGPIAYGRWLELFAAASLLSLLDLGGQNYFANVLAFHYANAEKTRFRETLEQAVSLFGFIAVGTALLGGTLVALFSTIPAPGTSAPLSIQEAGVLLCVGATFLIAIPGGIYAATYRATAQFTRGATLMNIARAIGLVLLLSILILKLPVLVYAVGLLLTGLAGTIIVWIDVRKRILEGVPLRLTFAAAKIGGTHLNRILHFWFISAAQLITQQGTVLLLGWMFDPLSVGLYATLRTLASIAGYIPSLIQGPLMPELSFLWAQGRQEELRALILKTVRVLVFLTASAAAFIWFVGPVVFPLLTRRHLRIDPQVLVLLLSQTVISCGWSTATWGLLATNHHRSIAFLQGANAALTLAGGFFLGRVYGLAGIAVAALGSELMCGLLVSPFIVSAFLKLKPTALLFHFFVALLSAAPLVALGHSLPQAPSAWQFAGVAVVGIVAFLILLRAMARGVSLSRYSVPSARKA